MISIGLSRRGIFSQQKRMSGNIQDTVLWRNTPRGTQKYLEVTCIYLRTGMIFCSILSSFVIFSFRFLKNGSMIGVEHFIAYPRIRSWISMGMWGSGLSATELRRVVTVRFGNLTGFLACSGAQEMPCSSRRAFRRSFSSRRASRRTWAE